MAASGTTETAAEEAWWAVAAACRGEIEPQLRRLAQAHTLEFDPDAALPPFRVERSGDASRFKIELTPIVAPCTEMEDAACTTACNPATEFVALITLRSGQLVARLPFAKQ